MQPEVGLVIGPYRLVEPVGAGGMGVVWKAHDTTLDREVALKFLPAEFARDPDRLARFQREARSAAALSHPGIVAVHGFGEHRGAPYVVMELLQGSTVRELLAAGPLAPERSLDLARQAARALVAAHERGVVHRDLKPENLFVLRGDQLKILDFGLAGSVVPGGERPVTDPGSTPTRTRLTAPGAVLGTTDYLSPEQLRGLVADARSDLFSLGTVLLETLAGRNPFRRDTAAETLGAILHHEPALPAGTSPAVARIVRRCLAKEPADRFQSAQELARAIDAALSSSMDRHSPRRWAVAGVLGGLLLAGLIAVGLGRFGAPARAPRPGPSTIGEPLSGSSEANEYFEKGLMFMRAQLDMPRAQAMLDRAIEIDPSYGSAKAMRALTELIAIHEGFRNDPSGVYGAERRLREIVREHPGLPSGHAVLGAALLYLNRKPQAREQLALARRLDPTSQPAEIWSVLDDRLSGRLGQAEGRARGMLEVTPLFWAARILLAEVLMDQERLDEARTEIAKVFEQDPHNLGARRALARCLLYAGRTAEARDVLQQVGAATHENFRVRLVWALQLAREGDAAAALAVLDEPTLRYAELAMFAQAQVAEIHALIGRADDAVEWLDRAVRAGDERSDWFRRDVLLDGIRTDARLVAILDTLDRGRS